ncbi:MAG: hypothetical protein LBS75_08040 [Synergistaceae bacterium]|jgi:DNA-binding Lrp family transcriptional regulator|nr:hypothetical protein [Synergistaceae bacterium]
MSVVMEERSAPGVWRGGGDCAAVASSLEAGLKIVPEPFLEVARETGVPEGRVLEIARGMVASGFIRRFGAFFDFRSFGLKGYLFGAELPGDGAGGVISSVCRMGCVTHCYARRHALGLWFTAILGGDGDARAIGGALRRRGLAFVALDVRERIKLCPSFAPPGAEHEPRDVRCGEVQPARLGARGMAIARALQDRFGISNRPYAEVADALGMGARGEGVVMDEAARLLEEGVLRRIGASLNHNRAGWMYNSLTAWDVSHLSESDALSAARSAVHGRRWASHCYLRRVIRSNLPCAWPYNLYIMIHARTEGEMEERERVLSLDLARGQTGNFVSMRTEAEHKKISFMI